MSNTEHAGYQQQVSPTTSMPSLQLLLTPACAKPLGPSPPYNWKCVPGQWLTYTLQLSLPFSARVVRPDAVSPVSGWLCKSKRRVKGVQRQRDLTGMPTELPELPDDKYSLPELDGAMFDSTVLAGDAIRAVADTWCRHALDGLHRAGRVVRPLRDAAERARAAARTAAALEEGDADERLTTSFVSSTDLDAGSGSTADSDSES
jgi:hypothetical protein